MPAVKARPQLALAERQVEDVELEAALEAREVAKAAAAAARKVYADADELAKGRIRQLELGATPARCGRFVISERKVAPRSVAFDTAATTRLTIRADVEDVF